MLRPLLAALALTVVVAGPAPAQAPSFRRPGFVFPAEAAGVPAFGDLDADGDTDLLCVPGGVFLNDGFGVFEPHPTPSPAVAAVGWWNPWSLGTILLADVNGDGADDAFLLPRGGPPALWLNGAGVFYDASFFLPPITPAPSPVTWTNWEFAAAADFDGDGWIDLFLAPRWACCGAPIVHLPTPPLLWLNTGAGYFVDASAQLPAINLASDGVLARDWDQDGDVDVVACLSPSYSPANPTFIVLPPLVRLVNTGTGTFVTGPSSNGGSALAPCDPGDLDGDGRPDILGYDAGLNLIWLRGLPGGTFAPGIPLTNLGLNMPLALIDTGGDGEAEILAWSGGPRLLDLDPAGTGLVMLQAISLPGFVPRVLLPDLDNDGDREVVFGSAAGPDFVIDGQGLLARIPLSQFSESTGYTESVADLDGDGDQDQLGRAGYDLVASVNDGIGRFAPGPPIAPHPGGQLVTSVLPFDADGDGDLDLYEGPPYSGSPQIDRLLRNDGAAGWTPWVVSPITGPSVFGASGDLDGDGDRDLVLDVSYQTVLLVNGGGGASWSPLTLATNPESNVRILIFDGDSDGDLDIFTAGPTGTFRFWRNLGGLVFQTTTLFVPSAGFAVAGDVDGDGDTDVVLEDRWLRNAGNGVFAEAGTPAAPAWTSGTGALADFDGDGDLDLAGIPSTTPYSIAIFVNDGAGAFSVAATLPRNSGYGGGIFAADFDRDGAPDLLDQGPTLWLNTRHRIEVRGIPTTGSRLRVQASGPPSTPWQLFASPARADFPHPPYGRVLLDPAGLFPVLSGTLDASGQADAPLSIPASPALAGLTLYWQAWMPGANRLTNAAATTVLDG